MLERYVVLIVIVLAVALSACSRNRANPPEAAIDRTRPLATILIPPVPMPETMFTDNRSPPVIGWLWVSLANTILDKEKSAAFEARFSGFRIQAGDRFAEHVRRELAGLGFAARLVGRGEMATGQVAPAAGQAPDAVLELSIDTLAMYSRRLDSNYLPTVDTSVWLAEAGNREEGLFSNSYIYGAYADRDGNGYITADPRFAFPSFDALLAQPELVEQSFDDGLRKTARQIALEIRRDFRPAPPVVAVTRAIPPAQTDPVSAATSAKTSAAAKKAGPGKSSRRPTTARQTSG